MHNRFVRAILFLWAFTLTSCVSEKRTSYELAYLIEGDSLKLVDRDSLKFEVDSISFMVQGKPQKVDSNVVDVYTSVTTQNGKSTHALFRYRSLNKRNKVLAEFYMVDNEVDGVFDSFSARGDVSLISEKIGEAWTAIQNTVREDINFLRQNGKKKVIDTATGEEIKEQKSD